MNRYSFVFAVLMAASLAVHAPRAGEKTATDEAEKKMFAPKRPGPQPEEPVAFIKQFVAKGALPAGAAAIKPQVLVATVAHPTETHLAAAFDDDVEAMLDGLQAAGYLFDSAWIPWRSYEPRSGFDDEVKEDQAKAQADSLPGVLLFRRKAEDPYAKGLVVFLVTEKPTEGISRAQIDAVPKILAEAGLGFGDTLRILGPRFSGSFASLAPAVDDLLGAAPQAKRIVLRSGSVTGGHAAECAVQQISAAHAKVNVDFGSTSHDYEDRILLIQTTLERLGITKKHTALLTEGQSLYGDMYAIAEHEEKKAEAGAGQDFCGKRIFTDRQRHLDIAGMWRIHFPRDISSVRTGYENQGLFDANSPAQPFKRFLDLKNDDHGEGDSVRSFGGPETMGARESVLFGISEFLKKHEIQAAIILATNEQDRFFLSRFLHANNSGVRLAVLDPTRLFLRGATAEFRGDMFVGEFPLLPLLHDWTGSGDDRAGHIFADDVSQGTYFAAIDLAVDESRPAKWASEYSEPNWTHQPNPAQRPPLYVVALGSSATWPVAEDSQLDFTANPADQGKVAMPFKLFARSTAKQPPGTPPAGATNAGEIQVGRFWRALFSILVLSTGIYCLAIGCANSIVSGTFASFEPLPGWRYWFFKVAVPAAAAGGAFLVMAWTVRLPSTAKWWYLCEVLTVVAPLAICGFAVWKGVWAVRMGWRREMIVAAVPVALAFAGLVPAGIFSVNPLATCSIASMLNLFREMHWESGLSLIPTAMLLLLGLFVWASEAGNGAATMKATPPLPTFPKNSRISDSRGKRIASFACPCPLGPGAKWLWLGWAAALMLALFGHFGLQAFREMTTLESKTVTERVFDGATVIIALMLFDLLQFVWLWIELRGLLRALAREPFKRSFVPIKDFNWHRLWTFSGISFESRRAIHTALIDSLTDLAGNHGLAGLRPAAQTLEALRSHYNGIDLRTVDPAAFANNNRLYFGILQQAGDGIALLLEHRGDPPPPKPASEKPPCLLVCSCKGPDQRFGDETDDLATLPPWQCAAEKFICLMYIGFVQTIVARLHTLLVAVACMFSAVALAIAIYPFEPFSPLVFAAVLLLVAIGWAFYKVFKEMDIDPILARIVNGDDTKLQGSFYKKLAESLALPLLTLASSLLPGGAGRLLELAQTLFNHGQ